jgi:hypothetical protein
MKFNQDLNPFDKKVEPKGFAAAKLLLRGKQVTWAELSDESDGLSTRTLGDLKRRFAAIDIDVVSTRKQNDGGTFYELKKAEGKAAAATSKKKTPKTARPTGERRDRSTPATELKAPAKKIIKKKAA